MTSVVRTNKSFDVHLNMEIILHSLSDLFPERYVDFQWLLLNDRALQKKDSEENMHNANELMK